MIASLRVVAEEHVVIAGLLVLYIMAGVGAGIGLPGDLLAPPTGMLPYFGFVLVGYLWYRWWGEVRGGKNAFRAWAALGNTDFLVRSLGGAALAYWLHLVILRTFLQWKSRIPVFHPYAWDERLAEWDRRLHLGAHPWDLLDPVLGVPFATFLLDRIYVAWFAVLTLFVLWQVFSSDRVTRWRFLVTYLLSWIVIGTILGITFSSVGPIFYRDIVGDPGGYAALLPYLEAVDRQYTLQALQLRAVLWQNYLDGGTAGVGGIAAMPSLHVGLSVLFALASWNRHRLLRWLFAAFAVLIFLGTVHLGWHYAIDGYVAAFGVWIIWWGTGQWVRRGRYTGLEQ